MKKRSRRKTALMRLIKESSPSLSSSDLTALLNESGYEFSERSVRLYLVELLDEGFLAVKGRNRFLSEKGIDYLRVQQLANGINYLSAKIDQMTYRMTFDLERKSGTVVVNMSVVPKEIFLRYLEPMCQVFEKGYAMGLLTTLIDSGECVGETIVPDGMVGFCTVCSVTLNGVLLKHAIPVTSRFGGLMQIEDNKPVRFVEIIHYEATSIDPLEVFIRSGMTDYCGAIRDGNGRIGAGFREIPADGKNLVESLAVRLKECGLGGFMKIGLNGQPLLDTPVGEGRIGAIVVGGLNPIAIIEENGHRIASRAMSGIMDYSRLFPYYELPDRMKKLSQKPSG